MSDQNMLTLRHADQARADFALIESNLEFIMGQLARMPTTDADPRVPMQDAVAGDRASIWALLAVVLLIR